MPFHFKFPGFGAGGTSAGAQADKAELDSFATPKSTLGLHTLYEPKDPKVRITADIVTVHGLGGDSFSTWTDKSSNNLWLRDFLPQSELFNKARIMTFGYDARAFIQPFARATTGRVFTFGEALLTALNDKRVATDTERRPIIFVGHSLGGIVIKSALVYAQSRPTLYGDIYSSTKSIYFFGTPHQGADAGSWLTYLGNISKAVGIRRANVTSELQRWSNPLVELTTLFSEQIPDLLIITFFEKKATYGVIVVTEASARLGQRNEISRGLDADHISICKYVDAEDGNYKLVLASFEATMKKVLQQMLASSRAEQSVSNTPETEGELVGNPTDMSASKVEASNQGFDRILDAPRPPTALDQTNSRMSDEGDSLQERFRNLRS